MARPTPRLVLLAATGALLLAATAARAEEALGAPAVEDRWTFIEAWSVFRADVDATIPGTHGGVYLLEHGPALPPWLARDAVRVATAPPVLELLARRLAAAGDREGIPALRSALERAGDEASRAALERALVRLGDERLRESAVRRLGSAIAAERWRAAESLSAAGDAAAPALRAALEDSDGQTRLAAAAALASRRDAAATALLVRALASSNPFERAEAAHGLAFARDGRALPVLRALLTAPGADRLRAVRSLGLVGGVPDRRLIVDLLGGPEAERDRGLRREALLALGRIALRTTLTDVGRGPEVLEEEEVLAALGRAVAQGATDRRAMARHVALSLEAALPGEADVVFERRRALTRPLAEFLAGRAPAEAAAGPASRLDVASARTALATVGGEADDRLARFDAAVRLLVVLADRLGRGATVEPPEARPIGVSAERAVDGNPLTSWVAGPRAGPLRLELETPRVLGRVLLIGGCVDGRASYRAHGRVRQIAVALDDGSPVTAELRDGDPFFQAVELPAGDRPARALRLEVRSTYPGERAGAPACIPEVRLE